MPQYTYRNLYGFNPPEGVVTTDTTAAEPENWDCPYCGAPVDRTGYRWAAKTCPDPACRKRYFRAQRAKIMRRWQAKRRAQKKEEK